MEHVRTIAIVIMAGSVAYGIVVIAKSMRDGAKQAEAASDEIRLLLTKMRMGSDNESS